MFIEIVDETGKVSNEILQQTQEILEFAAKKVRKRRQGDGSYFCDE